MVCPVAARRASKVGGRFRRMTLDTAPLPMLARQRWPELRPDFRPPLFRLDPFAAGRPAWRIASHQRRKALTRPSRMHASRDGREPGTF